MTLSSQNIPNKSPTYEYHRFLDEAGDTTFYSKGRIPNIGTNGVSKCFILGMLKIKEPLNVVRKKVEDLQKKILTDDWFANVPSIAKKNATMGYYLHAKDDVPEVRKMAYELIKSIDCSFEAIVARKIYKLYENKNNGKEAEFYADLLSHLLKNKLNKYETLVLNIAQRSRCTTHSNLQKGLMKALERSNKKFPDKENNCKVVFNVQNHTNEPLLNISDYFCWAIQRVFERGETGYYDFITNKISLVVDLYDFDKFNSGGNYYSKKKKLTEYNKL
ncbi:MAG: DUF3800 domain-containing protein [Cyclobacteriaceae bacterium]